MTEQEVHLLLSDVKIDNDNLDYIKMTGEICGKLRFDLVKLFAIPVVDGCCSCPRCNKIFESYEDAQNTVIKLPLTVRCMKHNLL